VPDVIVVNQRFIQGNKKYIIDNQIITITHCEFRLFIGEWDN